MSASGGRLAPAVCVCVSGPGAPAGLARQSRSWISRSITWILASGRHTFLNTCCWLPPPGTSNFTGKGYLVYGVAGPQGSLSFFSVNQTIAGETPTAGTNGTARLSPIDVITSDTFRITANTQAVNLLGFFRDHDADKTVSTMVEDAYVNHVPTMVGGTTREGLRLFYGHHFVNQVPPDWRITPISRTIGPSTDVTSSGMPVGCQPWPKTTDSGRSEPIHTPTAAPDSA